MKVNLLALDSASAVCGVAILQSDAGLSGLTVAEHEGSAQHAERMLPLIEQCLEEASIERSDLHAIAFAQGPGGFTGLRVACGVAQGLAYALGVQVAPIPSLLAIAAQQELLPNASIEIVVADARMQELYVGAYQRTQQGWYSLHKPILMAESAFYYYLQQLIQQQTELKTGTAVRVSGDGLCAFPALNQQVLSLGAQLGNTERVQVQTLAKLALLAFKQDQLIDPALAAPLYVRNRVAFTIAERETGLGGNPSALWQAVQFKPMTAEHFEAVAAIEHKLQYEPWSAGQFEQSIKAGHWGWVALYQDRVVAYAVVRPIVDEAELLLIGVAPDQQRQGIGQQLLCYIEQDAKAKNGLTMHLEVRESNTAARELYTGAGYYPVGIRKNYYKTSATAKEAAVLYSKILA
ncbi:tRNA (adenosine(37)-N6)-threonylcarbamoyltransferase complex dimerization subunit type 1 TsaB [Paenalcaligenes hominis]|uniref:tRNA (adenosine(37)-N6)-threonylcarbamoyltransferase complex dimerization subunit type 1 TsaB n=1 Tax=Paenalcaligenes hominis TaxID=643674 RepID=UPI003526065D